MMDWNAPTESIMKAWADAQRQLWEAWQSVVWPQEQPSAQLFEQWRALAVQTLGNWPGGEANDSIARQVADQLVASQTAVLRFIEWLSNTWTTLAPQIEQGQDWQTTLQAYADQMREQFAASQAGMGQATQDLNELWKMYLEEGQRLFQPWMQPLQQTPMFGAGIASGRGSDLLELTNLYWNAFERTFGSLLQTPGLGLTRELNEKMARGFDRWLEYRRASAGYQSKLADVWAEAFEQLIHDLADMAEKGETITSVRDLLLLWGQTADRVFIKAFQTNEYVQIQGQFLNTAMAFRVQMREIRDITLEYYDLPTREEVDEAHRNIYELRKEIKALKKQVADMQKTAAPRSRASSRRKTSPPEEATS
jgi:class III poly(R)-hydroxyalkanoic acid synthase PhaE subunit